MQDYSRPAIDLYRHWDAESNLLYVGISLNAAARASQHSKDKPWWPEVATITVQHLGTVSRADAERIEREAITDEKPRYNVIHNRSTSGWGHRDKNRKDRSIDHAWLLHSETRQTYTDLLHGIAQMGSLLDAAWDEDYSEGAFVNELAKMATLTLYPDACERCQDEGYFGEDLVVPFRAIDQGDGAEFRYACMRHHRVWSCWYAYKEMQ